MNKPMDVLLITGYLGSGKTTLLREILRLPEIAGREPALIINEFGEVGVDGRWFDGNAFTCFEINSGSLFCICTKADLLEAFQEIVKIRPGMVLIEATGVAETRDMEAILDEPGLAGEFRVRANLCVVDAVNFTQVAPFLKATRNQVAAADGLVINKIDVADEHTLGPLESLLQQMNPRAVRVRAARGVVTNSFLEQLEHQRTRDALAIAQPESVHAKSFIATTTIDRAQFYEAIAQLGGRLLRLKGVVRFSDQTMPEFVETVCGKTTTHLIEPDSRGTAFTAIAFGLPDGELQRVFAFMDDKNRST